MLWNITNELLDALRAKGAEGICKIVPSDNPWTVIKDAMGRLFDCKVHTRRTTRGIIHTYKVTLQAA